MHASAAGDIAPLSIIGRLAPSVIWDSRRNGLLDPLSRATQIFRSGQICQAADGLAGTRISIPKKLVRFDSPQESADHLLGDLAGRECGNAPIEYCRREEWVCHVESAGLHKDDLSNQFHSLRGKGLRVSKPYDEQPLRDARLGCRCDQEGLSEFAPKQLWLAYPV
jgi:hypothetical protein